MSGGPWNLLILRNTGNVLFNKLRSNLVNIWVLIRGSMWIKYGRSYSFHEWIAETTDGNQFSGNEFISLFNIQTKETFDRFPGQTSIFTNYEPNERKQ